MRGGVILNFLVLSKALKALSASLSKWAPFPPFSLHFLFIFPFPPVGGEKWAPSDASGPPTGAPLLRGKDEKEKRLIPKGPTCLPYYSLLSIFKPIHIHLSFSFPFLLLSLLWREQERRGKELMNTPVLPLPPQGVGGKGRGQKLRKALSLFLQVGPLPPYGGAHWACLPVFPRSSGPPLGAHFFPPPAPGGGL